LIGGRARLVIASAHGPQCVATDVVASEIAEHLPKLAAKRGLDVTLLFAALQAMPIDWKLPEDYEDQREQAQQRISHRDPDDWPTVALALKLELPVWSQDKDMDDAGLHVLTTGELLDAIRVAEQTE
jgi:predicted nucleic acid-binding protein